MRFTVSCCAPGLMTLEMAGTEGARQGGLAGRRRQTESGGPLGKVGSRAGGRHEVMGYGMGVLV